ncbi:hypothetical protein SITYG_10690 [Streptococcus intermedius]|uniref:Uncharacterized protein n=1 Tax=Streptococcus intermedius TaxID=1338 RepID=A0AAD1C8C3_STRIT|nr:hypothetical protein SITYG_10690 [Streptococcus intermedius]
MIFATITSNIFPPKLNENLLYLFIRKINKKAEKFFQLLRY